MPTTYPQVYESAVKEDNLQGEGYVQLEWNATTGTPIPAGEVCPLDSNFILFSTHWPNQQTAYKWRYSPKYQHRLAQIAYLPCYFKLKDADNHDVVLSTFPYMGDARTIAEYVVACLNEHGDLGEWTVGTIAVSGTKSMEFDGATIKSAAQTISDAWETEYFFNWADKTFNIGAVAEQQAASNTPQTGEGILVTASDGGIQYNCFRILGGTRNMSKKSVSGMNVAVTERLMLDPEEYPGSIIDKRTAGQLKIMKDVVFDSVFPKMELFVYDVRERPCYLCDEDGNKIPDAYELDGDGNRVIDPATGLPKVATDPVTGQPRYKRYSKWYFKLAYFDGTQMQPYHYDETLGIADLPLSLAFQMNERPGAASQPLISREFEVVYYSNANPDAEHGTDDVNPSAFQPEQGDFRVIFSVQNDLILPSSSTDGLCPYEHDTTNHQPSLLSNTVTLTNIAMDDVYIAAARKELADKGEAAADIESRDKTSFTYQTFGTAPALGTAVAGGIVSSVREDLITHEINYTVGYYQSSKSLLGRLSDKIEAATAGSGKGTTNTANPTVIPTVIQTGVPEDSIPVISQLAGVNTLRVGVERVRDIMGTKGILALLGIMIYEHIKDKMPVTIVLGSGSSGITPGTYSITYNNETLTPTGGITIPASGTTEGDDIRVYFEAIHQILGNYTLTIYGTVNEQATYGLYDLWLKSVTVPKVHMASGSNTAIEAYMWNGEDWELVREYIRSIIENLGNEIRAIVYGSNYQGQQATGLVIKLGELEAFSERFTTDDDGNIIGVSRSNLVLTSTSGVLSTDYYNAQGQRVTGASITTQVYSYQEGGETKYRSRLLLNGDNVAISGDCITFSATNSFTATVQGMGAIMKGDTAGNGSFSIGYYTNGNLVPVFSFVRQDNKTKVNLTADNCTIASELINISGKTVSITSLVDGSTAVFEGGKLKLDYIDAEQIVTNGLTAETIEATGLLTADTIDASQIWAGIIEATDGIFEGVTVKGNIFTPYTAITSSNKSNYIKTYTIGGTQYQEIILRDTNNIQIETAINGSVALPYVDDDSMLGCEIGILNLSGSDLDLVAGVKDASHITAFVARNASTGDVINNFALKNLCEAKFKLIDNSRKQYQGNAAPYAWVLVSVTQV